jgi:hypothetical protein
MTPSPFYNAAPLAGGADVAVYGVQQDLTPLAGVADARGRVAPTWLSPAFATIDAAAACGPAAAGMGTP